MTDSIKTGVAAFDFDVLTQVNRHKRRTVVGTRALGLDTASSDIDHMVAIQDGIDYAAANFDRCADGT